ncbi:MAG: RNA polymerase sigma factor, partial [Pyrinomonadaceae bacterium]
MAAYNITEEINSAAEVEFIDSTLPGLRLGTVKLEQKVGQLFERLRDPIYRYLVTTFGNPAEAEEITQEAFLRLYRHLHGGQSVDDARAWIFRVAHNLAVDQLKERTHIAPIDSASWNEICRLLQDPGLN